MMKTVNVGARAAAYNSYQSYLLRIWQETPQADWRIALVNTETGEEIGFGSLSKLMLFLLAKMVVRNPG